MNPYITIISNLQEKTERSCITANETNFYTKSIHFLVDNKH